MTFALATIDQQYAAAKRLYNIDAPERTSTPPQARHKELTGFAAYKKRRSYGQSTNTTHDELTKYKASQIHQILKIRWIGGSHTKGITPC